MSDVGRFGVFLPSYIWEGDGPERARGIKAFARRVEELGLRLACSSPTTCWRRSASTRSTGSSR